MTWQTALQQRLITRFSVEQRLLANGQVSLTGRREFAPRLLIGRDQCQYLCLNLEKVPRAKRQQALKLQIDTYTPWANTGFVCSWQAGFAQVWLWDADQLHQQLQEVAEQLPSARWKNPQLLAEVVYWSKPEDSGLHLFKASHGYDLQHWQDGVLKASQWFANVPGAQQIQRFARSQGLAGVPELAAAEPRLLAQPWAGVAEPVWTQWLEQRGPIALGLIAASLLVASLQVNAIARWWWVERSIQEETRTLEESANTLLSARSQARQARLELQDLQQLFLMPDPLTTQWQIYQRLPAGQNLTLVSWERNMNNVNLVVNGEITDTLSLVRALDRDGITDVRVEPQRVSNQYRIQLRLQQDAAGRAGNNE